MSSSLSSKWIDVHTHLDHLEEGVESALRLGDEAGLGAYITIGTEPKDHPIVFQLARRYYPKVVCTLGVHPHAAEIWGHQDQREIEEDIRTKSQDPCVVAIGEIGLDYFYKNSTSEVQMRAFLEQMQLAKECALPVEIHTRDAESDTLGVLKKFHGEVRGLLHCFTGTKDLAREALNFGYNISFSGIVTFRNADVLREVVAYVPLDRLHVETDAPFLSPVPMRGRPNTSAYLVHTAKCIAEIKGIGMEELAFQTAQNIANLFPKMSAIVKDCIQEFSRS